MSLSAGTLLSEVVCCIELQTPRHPDAVVGFHSIAALSLSAELQLASATKSESYWHTHIRARTQPSDCR